MSERIERIVRRVISRSRLILLLELDLKTSLRITLKTPKTERSRGKGHSESSGYYQAKFSSSSERVDKFHEFFRGAASIESDRYD